MSSPRFLSRRRLLGLVSAAGLLGGCGFQLRGPQRFVFDTLFIGLPPRSELGVALRREVEAGGSTKVVDDPQAAAARLEVLRERRTRDILSLNASGKVREYLLVYNFSFRLVDKEGKELIPPSEITQTRDMTFDENAVLAKEQEANTLYRDMQQDVVRQLVRRLAAVNAP